MLRLRVATRGGEDPAAIVERVLHGRGFALGEIRATRTTVEDAFVSMVRAESTAAGAS